MKKKRTTKKKNQKKSKSNQANTTKPTSQSKSTAKAATTTASSKTSSSSSKQAQPATRTSSKEFTTTSSDRPTAPSPEGKISSPRTYPKRRKWTWAWSRGLRRWGRLRIAARTKWRRLSSGEKTRSRLFRIDIRRLGNRIERQKLRLNLKRWIRGDCRILIKLNLHQTMWKTTMENLKNPHDIDSVIF